jgi:hypothetical protein
VKTYEQERYPGETIAQRVRRELADARAHKATTDRFIGEELRFLFDLDQYQNEPARQHRGDRIRPVDFAMYDDWEYRKGQVVQNAPIFVRASAVERSTDPAAQRRVELAKHRVDYQLRDNRFCNYDDVRERWIGGALAARMWAYRWDFDSRLGAAGEVVPRLVDPRMLYWPQGYMTPHDPACPRLHEVFRMPINEARAMPGWRNTEALRPDKGEAILDAIQASGTFTNGDTIYFDSSVRGDDAMLAGDGIATFCMTWYRFEFDRVKPPTHVALTADQRFMQCSSCDMKGPRQYELADLMNAPDFQLPKKEECPQCGGPMRRIDKEVRTPDQIAYEQGKCMVITCLNGSVEEELYDDSWPVPDCFSFPYAILTCQKEPHRAIPESRVSVGWNMTVGRNFTMAKIYEQAHASRATKLFPRRGIEDRNGTALDDMDSLADVLFYTSDLPQRAIDVIQGAPVSPALFQLYQLLHGAYKENEGSSRFSFGPQDSKDIPVGTLKQMTDSGNVNINAFMRAVYAAESISFTLLLAYLRKYDTEQRWIRFRGKDGKQAFELIRGIDLPDADITCSAGPDLSNVTEETIKAAMQLSQMPKELRRIIGRASGIDDSMLEELDQAQAEMEAAAAAQQPQPGAAPGAPPVPQLTGAPA